MLLPAEVHHDASIDLDGLAIEPVRSINPLPCRPKCLYRQGSIAADELHVFQTAILTDGGSDDYRSADTGRPREGWKYWIHAMQ